MKAIQSVSRYFPDQCGGIQIHLNELIPAMQRYGVDSKVAAAQVNSQETSYQHNGVDVYRYRVAATLRPEPNHGDLPLRGLERFVDWLLKQNADIYHQHQWTPECGLSHLRMAKELGMATVVTIHLPTPICQRNTLMLYGTQACDGHIDLVRCSRCCGVASQLPAMTLPILSRLPIPVGQSARGLLRRAGPLPPPLKTAVEALLSPLAIPAFVAARRDSLMKMAQLSDRIVAVSQWLYDALLINGIPEEKLALFRCGVSSCFQPAPTPALSLQRRITVGFVGRWNSTKGLHVLLDAIQELPADAPIDLIIYGIEDDEAYRQQMLGRIVKDCRIRVAPPLHRDELPAALANLDVLAVPSQWLETGPLVVLEAHACKVPVIGSNLGGIAELVQHGVNGVLVPAGDVQAWAAELRQWVQTPMRLEQLRQGIQSVRSIHTEAMQLASLYEEILSHRGTRSSSEVVSHC